MQSDKIQIRLTDLLIDETSKREQLLQLRESLLIQLRQVNAKLWPNASREERMRLERDLPKAVANKPALA